MEVLKAVARLNTLNSDIEKLDNWIADVQFSSKPVIGRSWIKVKKAIEDVLHELACERDELEEKIKVAVVDIEVDWK